MPDQRHHRGAHPEDRELFTPAAEGVLRQAVAELSWLLSRGYAQPSALKLVGDRHNLNVRQRVAVMRCACPDEAVTRRHERKLAPDQMKGRTLLLDGYNVLTTVEAALGGGVLIVGRDGCCRDLAALHGTWRKVEETQPAAGLIGEYLQQLGVGECTWLLDSPVSNSGRLATVLRQIGQERGWPWRVELVMNPDPVLIASAECIASADSVVLDGCRAWFNLAAHVVEQAVPAAWVLDLSGVPSSAPPRAPSPGTPGVGWGEGSGSMR